MKREWTSVARDEDGNLVVFEEIVYQHDVYRHGTGLYWRGGYIGRAA